MASNQPIFHTVTHLSYIIHTQITSRNNRILYTNNFSPKSTQNYNNSPPSPRASKDATTKARISTRTHTQNPQILPQKPTIFTPKPPPTPQAMISLQLYQKTYEIKPNFYPKFSASQLPHPRRPSHSPRCRSVKRAVNFIVVKLTWTISRSFVLCSQNKQDLRMQQSLRRQPAHSAIVHAHFTLWCRWVSVGNISRQGSLPRQYFCISVRRETNFSVQWGKYEAAVQAPGLFRPSQDGRTHKRTV